MVPYQEYGGAEDLLRTIIHGMPIAIGTPIHHALFVGEKEKGNLLASGDDDMMLDTRCEHQLAFPTDRRNHACLLASTPNVVAPAAQRPDPSSASSGCRESMSNGCAAAPKTGPSRRQVHRCVVAMLSNA